MLQVPDRAGRLAYSPDGKRLAVGTTAGKIHWWGLAAGQEIGQGVRDDSRRLVQIVELVLVIGAVADATGNLTAGMLLTVVAMGGAGVIFLCGMRYLEQDQRAALRWGQDALSAREEPT